MEVLRLEKQQITEKLKEDKDCQDLDSKATRMFLSRVAKGDCLYGWTWYTPEIRQHLCTIMQNAIDVYDGSQQKDDVLPILEDFLENFRLFGFFDDDKKLPEFEIMDKLISELRARCLKKR